MSVRVNDLGQPIGAPVPGWVPRPKPPRDPMVGRFCSLEPLDPDRHCADLYESNCEDREGRMWTYLPYGPFARSADYAAWARSVADREDPLFHVVIDTRTGRPAGIASYLRIDQGMGVIEVGHIAWSPRLQRTPAATEAMFLMMSRAFDELGYRRYEWKCDALNAPSRHAALRLGFRFEGIFRQAVIYKGRNRDTAWYAIVDCEWPTLRSAFRNWLLPTNFDADGRQIRSLGAFVLGSGTP